MILYFRIRVYTARVLLNLYKLMCGYFLIPKIHTFVKAKKKHNFKFIRILIVKEL